MATKKFRSQEKYQDRMRRLGHTRVAGWVPKHRRDEWLDIAEEWRIAHEKEQRVAKS